MGYDNNMSGVLYKNQEKKTDKHPDYTGKAEVDGVEYWLSAWIKDGKEGKPKFMSLAFKRKDEQQGGSGARHDDDDIPF